MAISHRLILSACALLMSTSFAAKIPENPNPQPMEWWEEEIIYQVYPRSHQDTDGDGVGDLAGIEAKLDHFVDLGIGAVWISPIYRSPMVDFGYDISNFTDIEPAFGTLESFKNLSAAMKERNIKLIMDFVPNHSSDQHAWFNMSIHRVGKYADYYVWKDPSGYNETTGAPLPPNNWKSVFNGPAWTFVPERGQFYLHQFTSGQPDLNWENREIHLEILAVYKFWLALFGISSRIDCLDLGVDGFRIDAVPHMYEDQRFLDEPVNPNRPPSALPDDHGYYSHIYTYDLPQVLDALAEMRDFMDVYTLADGQVRVMMVESTVNTPELFKYYGTDDQPIAHFPFNFDFMYQVGMNSEGVVNGSHVDEVVNRWLEMIPRGAWANWIMSNHDNIRVATRYGDKGVDIFNMVNLLLPGIAVTYYGEEIGMSNANISWEDTVDPLGCAQGPERYHLFSRDPERTPMHWNGHEANAGFSTANKTWLPMHPDWPELNVETQSDPSRPSHLQVYQQISRLRRTDTWKYGLLDAKAVKEGAMYGFSRIFQGKGFAVMINFDKEAQTINVPAQYEGVPSTATVYATSVGFEPDTAIGSTVDTNNLIIGPMHSIIIEF